MDTAKELRVLLAAQEKEFGAKHVKVANTLGALADLLVLRGQLEEAEQLYWRAVKIRHTACGATNLDVAATLDDLTSLYEQRGNVVEAERTLRWACDIRKKVSGANSAEYHSSVERLRRQSGGVDVVTADGDFQFPSPVPQRSEEFNWDEHFDHGVELQEKEEFALSEELFRNILAFAKHFAPLTIYHAQALDHLARNLLFQNRFQESRQHFEQALSIFENTVGSQDIDTVECLEGTADAHNALDEPEQARFLYTWAISVANSQGFADPADRITSKLLALPYVTSRRIEEESNQSAPHQEAQKAQSIGKTGDGLFSKPGYAFTAEQPGVRQSGNKGSSMMSKAGLNEMLGSIGSVPKNKTTNIPAQKPVIPALNQPAAHRPSGKPPSPVQGDTAHPAIMPDTPVAFQPASPTSPGSRMTGQFAMPSAVAPPVTVSAEVEELMAGGLDNLLADLGPRRKKTTGAIARIAVEIVPPIEEEESEPAKPPSAEALALAAGGLDNILMDIGPRRKKTTAAIIKPDFDLVAQAAAEHAVEVPEPATGKKNTGSTKKKTGSADKAAGKQGGMFKPLLKIGHAGGERDRKRVRPWQKVDPESLAEQLRPSAAQTEYHKPGASKATRPKPDPNAQVPEPDFSRATQMEQELKPEDPAEVAATWEKLSAHAETHLAQGNFNQAERLLILALEHAETFGESDPRLWRTELELAQLYEQDRKYVRAGHLYRTLLKQVGAALGQSHPDIIVYLSRLAELYMVQDRYDEAEMSYQQILAIITPAGDQGAIEDIMLRLTVVQKRRQQRAY